MHYDHSQTPPCSPLSCEGPLSFWENLPESTPRLATGQTHVWRAIVDIPPARLQVYQDTLSPDEQERARRYTVPRHRQRFIAARGILRHILARYLRIPPGDIRFESGPFGKPFLQEPARHPLHFNVAHSQQLAVYAVSRDVEVGIDLESDRDHLDYAKLAARICGPEEFTVFQKLPQAEHKAAFFRCWTRKEACVKATGKGLAFPLRHLTVSFDPDPPPRIPNPRFQPSGTGSQEPSPAWWSLFNLPLGQGFWGALAVAGQPGLVRGRDYHHDHGG